LKSPAKYELYAAVVDLKMLIWTAWKPLPGLRKIQPSSKQCSSPVSAMIKIREAAQAIASDYFEKDRMGGF
jgi:hypothetical protein